MPAQNDVELWTVLDFCVQTQRFIDGTVFDQRDACREAFKQLCMYKRTNRTLFVQCIGMMNERYKNAFHGCLNRWAGDCVPK